MFWSTGSVISPAICASSMFKVSARTSQKTGLAPTFVKLLTDVANVNDGTMTSSPGSTVNRAAISSAAVQDGVNRMWETPKYERKRSAHTRE